MKSPAFVICFLTLCSLACAIPGRVAAQDNLPGRAASAALQLAAIDRESTSGLLLEPLQYPSDYLTDYVVVARVTKPAEQLACEARCKKAYRRCYGQGNRPGTPEVHGGAPCSEQRVTCLCACAQ